jgi:hypothetical protein
MLPNTTLLSLCNTIASFLQSILNVFTPLLTPFGITLPSVSSICTTLFGS